MRHSLPLLCAAVALACGPAPGPAPSKRAAVHPTSAERAIRIAWQERFTAPLDWVAPGGHDPDTVASVLRIARQGPLSFLQASHDARPEAPTPPPAIHFGKSFRDEPIPLERVVDLQWRWRVQRHPEGADDPWRDVAASVYVITKTPGVFAGRGFKFAWLGMTGPEGTTQRGLLQIALRTLPASDAWQSESVDLCALHRKTYGPCEGEHVLYVGVMTDADGTKSLSAADYADFVLRVD